MNRRPVLGLAVNGDPRLRSALHAEIQFWHELDRVRLGIYQKAVRPYMRAVTRAPEMALAVQHKARVGCAEEHLPLNPLVDFGSMRLIEHARASAAELVHPTALAWLPDVREHFKLETE